MTEADGIIGMIEQVVPVLHQVVSNGAIASRELTEALLYLGMAKQKLVSSEEFAESEHSYLDESLVTLNQIFANTFDDSMRLIIQDLERTRELISTYIDRIGYKIDDIEKLIGIIQTSRGEEEMFAAGEPMLRAVLALEEYQNRL